MPLEGFFGTSTLRLDDKGRLTLPSRYRKDFEGGVVMTRGQDHCLFLFTPDGFTEFANEAINASITDPAARGFQRYMLANTELQQLDGQFRITVPQRMREYAALAKDVVVTGIGRRMEIWDAVAWNAYEAAQENAYAQPERGLLAT